MKVVRPTPTYIHVLLGVVVLCGLGLRTWNVNFDSSLNVHPDERSTTCFYAPSIGWPSSFEEFWDPQRSPLNPLWDRENERRRSFTYGHFPLYLGILNGELLSSLAPLGKLLPFSEKTVALMERANTACAGVAVAGRLMIGLLDTLTIFLLFLLGRRLYGAVGGLLAATLYAFTAQAVQLSHFFAMDPASTTFTVVAVYGGVVMMEGGWWRGVLYAGVGSGLAIASKFSAAPIVLVPLVAMLVVVWQTKGGSQGRGIWGESGSMQLLGGVVLALVLAFVSFFMTSPYGVLDWENFLQATLLEQGEMVRGLADMPFTRQYRNTVPYVYFIEQQVLWGLGLPLGLVGLVGVMWGLGKLLLLRSRPGELLVWAWLVPYFGITGGFLAKFNRYMSPVLPFVLLLVAGMLVAFSEDAGGRVRYGLFRNGVSYPMGFNTWIVHQRRVRYGLVRKGVSYLLALVGIVGGMLWSLAYVNGVYSREHTWVQSSRWVYANVESGSVILWELWDDPLPKGIPGEPGMDMGSHGLRHIDWSPYEEDTAEKYEILKGKLREADYVIYSSKRIYGSVDELPERYPMTTRYYELMFAEELGYVQVADIRSGPRLWGWEWDGQGADESWSLYDHPRVTVFAKERELSDAEFDALLGSSWEGAIPWYRGQDPPFSAFLIALGLGSSQESRGRGLLNNILALLPGQEVAASQPPLEQRLDLSLAMPLHELPLVDNYRWNTVASENSWLAVGWWWFVISLLGWIAWPLAFVLFRRLRDRGYLVSKTLGWLLAGWLLWLCASFGLAHNTVRNAWLTVVLLALLSGVVLIRGRWDFWKYTRRMWRILLLGEGLFAGAFVLFVFIRMGNPDIWQPWFGGEKFMEFAFLNGILRSPTFPPLDPHFAGGYINYYYYGIYLVGYLIKLSGIYAEVAFNLAIPTLFALTVINAFCVAYTAVAREDPIRPSTDDWRSGIGRALLAPLFVAFIGNLDSCAQLVRKLVAVSDSHFQSALPALQTIVHAASGLWQVLTTDRSLPGYDFWAPSRVIPFTINEFPYWSFTYADLHPHMIGIPFSIFFLALVLTLLNSYDMDWRRHWRYGLLLLGGFAFTLGVLANVNLWELPTYYGLGTLAFAIALYRGRTAVKAQQNPDSDRLQTIGHRPGLWVGFAVLCLAATYLLFLPFFRNYTNVAASGVGSVRTPDDVGTWLLIWGFFGFILFSWMLIEGFRGHKHEKPLVIDQGPVTSEQQVQDIAVPSLALSPAHGENNRPTGLARTFELIGGQFARLPRLIQLYRLLIARPTVGYVTGVLLIPLLVLVSLVLLLFTEHTILALCLPFLGLAFLLLWRQGHSAEPGALYIALLTTTGLALLASTQVIYLKDFLQGGDWYRMNTLFKFFIQVWVLWGVAAAIALPRILKSHWPLAPDQWPVKSAVWGFIFLLLFSASLVYPLWGTPARLAQRFPGWQPQLGTLDGMAYMENGVYFWPDGNNAIELRYDWEAIQWLLANVRGNVVVVESAEIDYYRAGGTRVASLTGLSGLTGMHEGEQRYADLVGARAGVLNEFWNTEDMGRIQQLIAELDIGLIYVGQLERHQHPAAVERLRQLAADDELQTVYQNEKVTIYGVPSQMIRTNDGVYIPVQNPSG